MSTGADMEEEQILKDLIKDMTRKIQTIISKVMECRYVDAPLISHKYLAYKNMASNGIAPSGIYINDMLEYEIFMSSFRSKTTFIITSMGNVIYTTSDFADPQFTPETLTDIILGNVKKRITTYPRGL